jgi:hypothetical protein
VITHADTRGSSVCRATKAVVPAVVFVAVLILSVVSGRPASLPGAALGSVWLLHVERAAVALGAAGAVWLVGWRALHGNFPVRFGNIEYGHELTSFTDAVAATHEQRIERLEGYIRERPSGEGVQFATEEQDD